MSKKLTYSLCIHGGAGVITREDLSEKEKELVLKDLNKCLILGENILKKGGSAIDAVCAAVTHLEDSERFNAGKGAVYSNSGQHFLEASIMDGANLKAGALANSRLIKNPVIVAKDLMNKENVVLLAGDAADEFAKNAGHDMVENSYFNTPFRKEQWEYAKSLSESAIFLDHTNLKMGTVGAVARDQHGQLAAATSTGGMTNKLDGRIGDTAIIGAGTYANNKTCAVSCTGVGEFFIRATVASLVSNLMEYGGMSLEAASHKAIHEHQAILGGTGGLIAIDCEGNITMPYNSEGMYRGYSSESSNTRKVFIWDVEEKL